MLKRDYETYSRRQKTRIRKALKQDAEPPEQQKIFRTKSRKYLSST